MNQRGLREWPEVFLPVSHLAKGEVAIPLTAHERV